MHCVGLVMDGLSHRQRAILHGTSIQMKSTGLLKASRRRIPDSKLDHGHTKVVGIGYEICSHEL